MSKSDVKWKETANIVEAGWGTNIMHVFAVFAGSEMWASFLKLDSFHRVHFCAI